MKVKSTRAVLVAALFGAASLMAANAWAQMGGGMSSSPPPASKGAATAGPKVSKAVAKQLTDTQGLMKAGDFKGALDKVHEAQAQPDQTDDDKFVVNEFLAQISINLKDYDTAGTAYEAMADSSVMQTLPPDQKTQTLHNAIILASNAKHYQKAVDYGKQLQALGPVDDKTAAALSQAYFFTNDFADAKAMAQQSVDSAKKAGQPPEQAALQIIMNADVQAKDEAGAEAALEELAGDYGNPEDWGQLLDLALSTKGLRDLDALYLSRLRMVTGATGKPDDYNIVANIALQLGYPGEARAALEQGIQKGTISDSGKIASMLSSARSKAAVDEKSLGGQISAGAGQGGEYNIKLAEALYGYGRYADSEAAARRALAKGGTKDPTEPQMVLGMALVGQGKYAEAASTFQQVSGGPATNKAAHLWTVYAQHKAAPPPADAAPAAQASQ